MAARIASGELPVEANTMLRVPMGITSGSGPDAAKPSQAERSCPLAEVRNDDVRAVRIRPIVCTGLLTCAVMRLL